MSALPGRQLKVPAWLERGTLAATALALASWVLLPANPVSALVVFEVMVRPLIRLSLGKRQPMRRMIRARTIKPITSVADRSGFLRGQLLRDEDTGDYLVEVIGDTPGGSSHLLASLADANCLVVVPSTVTEISAGEFVDVAFLAQRG